MKQKEQACKFFDLRVKKYFKYQTLLVLLFVALFVFSLRVSAACREGIMIYEVYGGGGNSGAIYDSDYVVIYNSAEDEISLDGWLLQYASFNGLFTSGKTTPLSKTVSAKGYYLVSQGNNGDTGKILPAIDKVGAIKANLAADKGKLALVHGADIINSENIELYDDFVLYEGGSNNKSIYRKNSLCMDTNIFSVDFGTHLPDPKNSLIMNNEEDENENDEDEEGDETDSESKIYSDKIIINEIFPAPVKNSGLVEFVELYSSSDKVENLDGWYLKDRAGKNCALTGNIIDPAISRFLTLKNDTDKKCTLALNDTQGEFLGLYNPTDLAAVFAVSYEGSAKKGRSYNFDGSSWFWSQFLTEGKKNIFNSQPYGKVKIDDNVFENVYADFSVSTGDGDGDKIKISWDFGDGHKSSLAKTRHKYEKTGMYNGSVKLSDGSEDVLQNFVVEVKKLPHPEVKIITINANPAGADTGVEYITVQNKSKNKINLNGWSIATGWKKFINHPIREDVIIKKDKLKEITSVVSSFTLNNTKSKIQLRYPDGKVAYEVKYKSPNKTIADGEIYQKVKGGWAWAKPKQDTIIKKQDTNNIQNSIINNQGNANIKNIEENKIEEIVVPVEIIERENKLLVNGSENVRIKLLKATPRVLGAETVREVDGIYFFTPQIPEKEHYAIVFLKNIFLSLNLQLNNLLNFFYHSTS
ncbi:MAG: lamin tail domain-containing protein [Candidatus Moranbacteria bacterium]|nr:lamin tail domain-containing protein [Candidatus Moranbacteria bacterium]